MTFLEAVYLFVQTFIHERPRAKSMTEEIGTQANIVQLNKDSYIGFLVLSS